MGSEVAQLGRITHTNTHMYMLNSPVYQVCDALVEVLSIVYNVCDSSPAS